MKNILSIIFVLQVITVKSDYEVRCPVAAEWRFRGEKFNCGDTQYVCLFRSPGNKNHETCDGLDYSSTGSKLIFEPYFNKALCVYNRYQPFPFSTDGSSKCVFQKSFCNEKGIYVFHTGSLKSDITCGCDLSKGYEFVTKPKNNCFCIPSEEDCSCHKIPCNNKDKQCPSDSDEMLTRSLTDNHVLTTLVLNRFNNADDDYNVKRHRFQCLYIITVLLSFMMAVVFLYNACINCIILQRTKQSLRRYQVIEAERNRYSDAIRFGTEIRQYVRIHVIGKARVGKTSLVHRLLGKGVYDGTSTDGIDIDETCQIRKSDGEWIVGEVETEKRERMMRLLHAVDINRKEKEPTSKQSHELSKKEETRNDHSIDTENSNVEKTYDITDAVTKEMDDIVVDAKNQKEKNISEGLVECGIWDFAGQRDYYATHQTFLTPNAIYILVADITEDIKSFKQDEEYNTIDDYIDFWFDCIHCFCEDDSDHQLYPPVIMVCTGTDKIKEVEDRKRDYNEQFDKIFHGQPKVNHRRGIYFVSNKEDGNEEIVKLKSQISRIAKEMEYFAEKLPTKWIHLETALATLKGLDIDVYEWENMLKLAKKNSIEEDELLLFLNNQHKIGNVIFFNELRDYIILQPYWLVKCFRCLVDDWNPEKRKETSLSETACQTLKTTGELSETLIDQLFQKEPTLQFGDRRLHLLRVMEKFDIIVRPEFRDTNNDKCQKSHSYYLPCMIKQSLSFNVIKEIFITENVKVTLTPWLVFEFKFLPLAYFNHILFYYLRNYTVCEVETGLPAVYMGKAVFYLDHENLSKFIVCFSRNAISLQIWNWSDVDEDMNKHIFNELCDQIENIRGTLGQNISHHIKAKCRTGDFNKSAGRISLTEIKITKKDVYFCKEHNDTHSKEDIEKIWLKHDIQRKKKIQTEPDKDEKRREEKSARAKTKISENKKVEHFEEDTLLDKEGGEKGCPTLRSNIHGIYKQHCRRRFVPRFLPVPSLILLYA